MISKLFWKFFDRNIAEDNFFYRTYLQYRYPEYTLRKYHEKSFYMQIFGKQRRLAFDIGANVGGKTRIFTNHFKCIVAVEPCSSTYKTLSRRFAGDDNVETLQLAVGGKNGFARLHLSNESHALHKMKMNAELQSDNPKEFFEDVQVITLNDLAEQYGRPNYIKLDIEGSEKEAILALTFAPKLISFEANLPEAKKETETIINHLNELCPTMLFNFTVHEPPTALESATWMSSGEILDVLIDFSGPYMEIFGQDLSSKR